MVDTERREQILKAEGTIRQLAEKMAENLAGRNAAEEAATAFRCGYETLAEANRTLCVSSRKADEAQQAFSKSQAEWLSTIASLGRASKEGAEEIRRSGRQIISDLQGSKAKFDAAIAEMESEMRSGNETFSRTCGVLAEGMAARQRDLEKHGRKQEATFEAGQELLASLGRASIESTEQLRGCGGQVVSDLQGSQAKFDASITEMQSEMHSGNETFSRTCAVLVDGMAACKRDLEEHGRKQVATFEAGQDLLARRINLGNALCGALLIAILLILAFR
jgi:hypothetical protein